MKMEIEKATVEMFVSEGFKISRAQSEVSLQISNGWVAPKIVSKLHQYRNWCPFGKGVSPVKMYDQVFKTEQSAIRFVEEFMRHFESVNQSNHITAGMVGS